MPPALGAMIDAQAIRTWTTLTCRVRCAAIVGAPDVTVTQNDVLLARSFRGVPGTAFAPLTVAEVYTIIKHRLLTAFGFYHTYGDGVAVPAAHTPDPAAPFAPGPNAWVGDYLWHVTAGAALPVGGTYAAMRTHAQSLLAPASGDVVGRAHVVTVTRRNMLALDILHYLGFDGPFDTMAYPGRLAWMAAVKIPQLMATWRDGLRWLECGEMAAAPTTLNDTIKQ
eukprot:gene3555-7856_t